MTDGPARIKTSDARLRGAQPSSSRDRSYRTSTSKQPWVPPTPSPTDVTSQQFVPTDPGEASHRMNRTPDTEEPFQRFYSTFGGLISKLSAPLAFAGLPLGSDMSAQAEQSRKSTAETKLNRHHATSERINQSAEPDVSKLFSRAALQAIRDTPGGGGGGVGGVGNTAESFYVVPTTGGTISYAGILTRAEKEARRNSLEEGDEDFVDARETPSSPELRQNFVGSKGKTGRGNDKLSNLQGPKSMEELQMENQALRHLSDTLSKRLHMWEVNAQSSSMALQQSLKAIHHQNIPSPEQQPQASSTVASPIAPLSAPSTSDQDLRIKELEDLVRRSEKDLEKAGRENEKLRSVLGRYRERWEKLKEGAKTRRAEGRSSTDNTAVNTATLSSATDVRGNERRPSGETENEANLNDEPDVKADVSAT
ncbi:hypothetical protein EYZ11_007385 [Aspergillus tanneri]|nr:hypothetical protein EYZ11_007385 [Aspergillus tanneri]